MANVKISDAAVFIPTADVTTIDGIACFTGAGVANASISGADLITSLQNEMVSRSVIVGAAKEVGDTGSAVSNVRQVVWAYPTVSVSNYGPCMVVPTAMTIKAVHIKWQNSTAPTIDPGDGTVEWRLGKLTTPSGDPDTDDGVTNYTNVLNLPLLDISSADSGTHIFKDSGAISATYVKGDVLVLLHSEPTGDWSITTGDIIVTMLVEM